ncbi:MAG: hypothetical protein ACTHJ2_09625 [Candidatus Nitrosocosmicus sp.]
MNTTSQMFYVKNPKGEVYEIPEENLDAALAQDPNNEIVENFQRTTQIQTPNEQTDEQTQNILQPNTTDLNVRQNPIKNVYMRDSQGGIFEIPEHNVEAAKKAGGVLIEEKDIPEDPHNANSWNKKDQEQNLSTKDEEQNLSTIDRLRQFGMGLAEVPAVVADLGDRYVAAPFELAKARGLELAGDVAGKVSETAATSLKQASKERYENVDKLRKSNYTEKVHEKFNELAGKDITPKDKTGKFLTAAGSFSFPVPGAGVLGGATVRTIASQGLKEGAKRVAGGIGKNAAVGTAGAAALEGTRDISAFKEGSVGAHVEDFLKTVVGMSLADKGLSAAKKAILSKTSKNLENIIDHSNNLIKEESIGTLENIRTKAAGKILSLGAKPNHEINALAKKYNIQLPFEVALGGKLHQFISNTFLKSLFTAQVYENVIKNADKDMINAVKEKISTISPESISGDIASSRTRDFLRSEKSEINNEVRRLYQEEAYPLLKSTDAHAPTEVVSFIKDVLENNLALSADVPGPAAKPIALYLKQIGERWGFIPPKNSLSQFEDSPDFLKKVADYYIKNVKEVPVKKMISQLQSTYQHTKYNKDIEGLPNIFNGLVGALQRDIDKTANKEFLKKWRSANKYMKQEKVDRIKADISRSIMNGEVPKEAFTYMSAAPEVRKLKQILGNSENGQTIFNELRRAKVDQIVSDKIIDASGSILYSKLSNLFLKNPEQQALLKELLGDSYDGMRELSKISQQFVRSGKEFGNPSKTTLSARDVEGIKDIFKIGLNTVASVGAGVAKHGILGAIEGPVAIHLVSMLVSNKKYIDMALKYSKSKEPKTKLTLSNRLGRIAKDILVDTPTNYPQSVISQKSLINDSE